MSLYALDAIDDALAATGRYRPRDVREWAWVVLVAALVASPGFGVPTGGTSGGGMPAESRVVLDEALPAALPDLLHVAGAAAVGLWLCVGVVGSFLEFPFLRWLRDGEVATREEVRANRRSGLGLAGFRVAIRLSSVLAVVWTAVAVADGRPGPETYLAVLGEYWVPFGVLALLTGVVSAYTTSFVVPAMWLEEASVVEGWRRVWPTVREEPTQFLAFGVAVAVLATLGGILLAVAAAVAAVPALVAGLAVATAAGGAAGFGVAVLVGGVLGAVVVGPVYAFLQVFLRYYALFVLGDVDPFLDAIPYRRREIRARTGGATDVDSRRRGADDTGVDGDVSGGESDDTREGDEDDTDDADEDDTDDEGDDGDGGAIMQTP